MKSLAFLIALSLPLLSSLTACTKQPATTSTSNPPIPLGETRQAQLPPEPPPSCAPSAESQRMATLVNSQSYNAAEGLFNRLLLNYPDDARLHVEYTRYLLLSSDLANSGFISSPIMQGDRFWAADVAREAGKRAIQLDDSCKDMLADEIHSILLSRIGEALAENKGIIGEQRSVYYPKANSQAIETGFSVSMINLAWVALDLSPGQSGVYLNRYRKLMELAIAKGKIATAAMLGNLLGDLEKGDTTGDLDFAYACDAFARALENFEPSDESDWIASTIDILHDIFKQDLANADGSFAPDSLSRLRRELELRGYSLFAEGVTPYGLREGTTGSAPRQP